MEYRMRLEGTAHVILVLMLFYLKDVISALTCKGSDDIIASQGAMCITESEKATISRSQSCLTRVLQGTPETCSSKACTEINIRIKPGVFRNVGDRIWSVAGCYNQMTDLLICSESRDAATMTPSSPSVPDVASTLISYPFTTHIPINESTPDAKSSVESATVSVTIATDIYANMTANQTLVAVATDIYANMTANQTLVTIATDIYANMTTNQTLVNLNTTAITINKTTTSTLAMTSTLSAANTANLPMTANTASKQTDINATNPINTTATPSESSQNTTGNSSVISTTAEQETTTESAATSTSTIPTTTNIAESTERNLPDFKGCLTAAVTFCSDTCMSSSVEVTAGWYSGTDLKDQLGSADLDIHVVGCCDTKNCRIDDGVERKAVCNFGDQISTVEVKCEDWCYSLLRENNYGQTSVTHGCLEDLSLRETSFKGEEFRCTAMYKEGMCVEATNSSECLRCCYGNRCNKWNTKEFLLTEGNGKRGQLPLISLLLGLVSFPIGCC